ncbi:MAG TPA: zinc ribbon domain-containing protein [Vicinamibacterales bacterium]|nr:zinc ribbon domain-containing protein [Vicinamibacterales bacterium]
MAPDARALHCPNCGGPAGPGDAACRYCKAALATVSCPSCFALMFDGAVYCPSCGARRARTSASERHAPCPACKGVMRELEIGDTVLLECERCHAAWVDAKTFEHICASNEAQAAVLHRWTEGERSPGAAAKPGTEAGVRYRKCVACGTMMNRLNFGRLSGTIVDVCRGHGTFLDAGELHRIVRFIQGGGLDRARQRQIDDLKEQEDRLRRAQMARPAPAGDFDYDAWTRADIQRLFDQLRRS